MVRRRMSILVGLVAMLACGPARPSFGEWKRAWARMQAAVPDTEAFEADAGRGVCRELLLATRELRGRLLPTPDRALDPAVEAWLEEAGRIGFECQAPDHDEEKFRRQIRALRALSAEVNAAIRYDTN